MRTKLTLAALACALAIAPAGAKELRFAFQGDADSMDPYTLNETFTLGFLGNIYEGLIRRGPDLTIEPALAVRWEIAAPDRWRFHLRRGVKFHEGEDFTADDVLFSADRVRAKGSDLTTRLAGVKEVVKIDDYTVEFATEAPNPILHVEWGSWGVMSKSWSEKHNAATPEAMADDQEKYTTRHANGTGPFRLVSREAGIRAVAVPNPNWWDNANKVHNLTKVTFTPIASDATRVPAAWKEELGPDWAQIWHAWRHTVGNLTVTGYNSEMGNAPFREKRDAERGFCDSPLRLNADLRQAGRWDGEAIRARGERLAGEAVGIWRRPVLPDRVLASYRADDTGGGGYTIGHHPHLRPGAPMHDLFEAIRQSILALGPEVREEVRRHYVAYKWRTNFVDVVPQKHRLLPTLNMRFAEIDDPRGLAADITNLGLWGNGDVQVELDNERQIPYAMELVRQARAGKRQGGTAGD